MLEYIILGFLMEKELSGYDLKQKMSQSTSYFFDASFGSIYPALKRLEEKGYICYREVIDGGKLKKLYSITNIGKSYFLEWLEKPIKFSKTKHDHLVNIFFYEYLPKEIIETNLKMLIAEVELLLNKLDTQKTEVEQNCCIDQYTYMYFTMIYGVDYYSFVINWCNDLLKKL
ncbi:PadR family transcriptional regulator [Clostridioides sp. ZZV13-5731]|uniref:PadR family transcriptional regulator n=1 Tax=unclassified Clostridioides TaxID=2635829 RepID=UPI001D112573|nr:PadR family transcriptional regulator [Clostridioides sp. ZZV14-6150]MCC0742798.1 PadR family transcriptional regulator [Clostridioides sp. ZZV14-6044]MCC0751247.1 PadR family transcriptional regulator [Clostridioides sp. ZZV13-5731]